MELKDQKTMSSSQDDNKEEVVVDEEEGRLPGFRFHPTDQELVTFYLKRKVEKRPISIEIIKQIDIYKHDPWELSKASSVGDKEWYFYCRRERKYRNSVRPNRVTGSGFWKATGIDKPIYSNGGQGNHCVGLKKSLVYYRGSAGKGTKTDWMMHEFRLPTDQQQQQYAGSIPRDTLQEAEVWTLCRIFKRNRKYTPDWRELSSKRTAAVTSSATISSKACSDESIKNRERYISFANATNQQQRQPKYETTNYRNVHTDLRSTEIARHLKEEPDTKKTINQNSTCNDIAGLSMAHTSASDASNLSSPLNPSSSVDDQAWQLDLLPAYGGNWDDLTSVVEFAIRAPL